MGDCGSGKLTVDLATAGRATRCTTFRMEPRRCSWRVSLQCSPKTSSSILNVASLMKEVLSKPGINHKFVKGLSGVPGITIYRKSGTWRDWHSDAALIEWNGHRYVLAALTEDPDGGKLLEKLAARRSRNRLPLTELIIPGSLFRSGLQFSDVRRPS